MANPLGAALIGALGSAAGGLLTAHSIDEQNARADAQFRANLAFQRYQYEDMKHWQSPANQVRLLKQAGINPSLALNSSLAGNSLQGVGGVSPTASNMAADFSSLPSSAASLVSSLGQNSLLQSEEDRNYSEAASSLQDAMGTVIENQYKAGNLHAAQQLTKQQARLTGVEAQFQQDTLERRIESEQFKTALLMAQVEAQGITNKNLDEQQKATIANLWASAAAARASGRLSDEQAAEVVMRKIASFGLSEDDALDLFDSSMDFLDSQAELNSSSAFSNYTGDVKKNPFVLSHGAFNIGQVHETQRIRRNRQAVRRLARQKRHRPSR